MFKKLTYLFLLMIIFNNCLSASDNIDIFNFKHSLMPVKKEDEELKKTNDKNINVDTVENVYKQKSDEYNTLKTKYDNIKKELEQIQVKKTNVSSLNSSKTKLNTPIKQNSSKNNNSFKQTSIKSILSRLHLASYKDEQSTYKGIKIFKNLYDKENHFDTSVQYEYVEKKGWFYRIYFLGEKEELIKLCNHIKSKGDWCSLK